MYKPNVDIMGYKRGAHHEGELICDGFVFTQPGGRKDASGDPIFGWNDTAAVRCAKCGEKDDEHVNLGDVNEEMDKAEQDRRGRVARASELARSKGGNLPAAPRPAPAAQTETWLLDDTNDPLSASAGKKAAQPRPTASPTPTAAGARGASSAAMTADEFKNEVERMVRESLETGASAPASAASAELVEKLAAAERQLAAARAQLEQAGLA